MRTDDWLLDVRYALRMFRRTPGFTAVAVTMLAIGIGLNAAVFTVANAILFKGFPLVQRNDRLVYLDTLTDGRGCCVSYPDFEAWRAQATSFDGMGAVADLGVALEDADGFAEMYHATQVTANTFGLLGQKPVIGRDFVASDELPGAPPVAILRYGFWQRRYGASPVVVGQTIRVNGVPTTVIGVMPSGLSFPQNQDLWLPLVPTPEFQRRARGLWFAFGRLAEGETVEGARAEMDTIGRRLAAAWPQTNQGVVPVVRTFPQFFIGRNAAAIYGSMWGAVGLVLLIACANLANLLLGRAVVRSRELAVRVAVGAGRWRLVRQLLVESLMLSAAGGVCGCWLARLGLAAYERAAAPAALSWSVGLVDYSMDRATVQYFVAVSIGTGLLFGIAPALELSRMDLLSALKDGRRGTVARTSRTSGLLVAAEMALAIILLTGAGVLIRSFLRVYNADPGVKTAHVLTALLNLPEGKYSRTETQTSFFYRLEARLEASGDIESVAMADYLPTWGARRMAYEIAGAPPVDAARRAELSAVVVTPGYFRTLGAPVISGREFSDTDGTSTPVAIVNRRLASRSWPGETPIGKRVRLFDKDRAQPWMTIVGIAPDIVQNDQTRQTADPLIYLPFRQAPKRSMWVVARTRVPPESAANTFRREVQAVDADLPIWLGPLPLTERLAGVYWARALYGALFLTFASVALLLASIGLYAVVSQAVGRRTQEIGIRVAVGASRRDILSLVFRQGMGSAAAGLTVGLLASLAANRILQSMLVRVSSSDPVTFIASAATLILAATLGCAIPAARALRLDPVVALRHE